MTQLRDHDQQCEHGLRRGHAAPIDSISTEIPWCPGGAEVKGPQFTAGQAGPLVIKDRLVGGSYGDWSIDIAVAKDQRYQLIEIDNPYPVQDLLPVPEKDPELEHFRQMLRRPSFLDALAHAMKSVMHDAVRAEITRQLGPAIIAAMQRTKWELNAEDPF